jgi:adenylate cyclase/guanylate cyclase
LNARRITRDVIAATAIALACAGVAVSPALDRIHGLSLDILTALRFEMFGNRYSPATSPAVVVAIDEETYRTAPFKGSPTMAWTGEMWGNTSATQCTKE